MHSEDGEQQQTNYQSLCIQFPFLPLHEISTVRRIKEVPSRVSVSSQFTSTFLETAALFRTRVKSDCAWKCLAAHASDSSESGESGEKI